MTFESPLKNPRWATLWIGVVAGLVYLNSLGNGFAYDDIHIVVDNPALESLSQLPSTLMGPYWAIEDGEAMGLWRPTTTTVLAVQHALVGEDPLLYHAVNVLGHTLVSILVLHLLLTLMSLPGAFAAGLLFAVHPVHVESVANVVGIAEILSSLFFLAACFLHLRGPAASGWGRSLAIGLLYLVAFGAKESAVTLPGAIFLLDAVRGRLGFREVGSYLARRWRLYLSMLLVALFLLFLRHQVLGNIASAEASLGAEILADIPRIWTLGEVWTHYVRLMVFPLELSADYSPNVIPISWGWTAANVTGFILALGIMGATWVAWRREPVGPGSSSPRLAAFAVVWFIITISPVANVVFLTGVLLAERTLYLPSVGVVAGMGWLVVRLSRDRPRGAWVALAVVVLLASIRVWERNPTWRSTSVVFGTMIEDHPQSGRSQWALGTLFFQRGRVSEALRSYRVAVNLLGPNPRLIHDLSRRLVGLEQLGPAQNLLEMVLKEDPGRASAASLITVIRSQLGDAEGTERWARTSLLLESENPVQQHLLAWALANQGRWDEAIEARRLAFEAGEGDFWQQWMALAQLNAFQGDTISALESLDSARTRAFGRGAMRQVDSLYESFQGGPSVAPLPR